MGITSINSNASNALPAPTSGAAGAAASAVVAQAQTEQVQPQKEPSAAELKAAIKAVESAVQAKANNLKFSVDDTTGQTVVTVIDGSTGSKIRQIPSEDVLAISRSIEQMKSLLFKDKA